jgi:alpha/beta superfamily hydrolase
MQPVKIIEIGAEGGCITLSGWKTPRGIWQFQRDTDERTMQDLLSEEDAAGLQLRSVSPVASGWEGALRILGHYRWQLLYPLYVHPEFADLVWQEVEKVELDSWQLERWSEVCGKMINHHTVCFSHGKESGPWGVKITALAKVAENLGFSVTSIDYRKESDPELRVKRLCCEFEPSDGINVLVGSSMGGYVAAIASRHLNPDGLFLMAPAFGIEGYREQCPTPAARKITVVHGLNDMIVPCRNSVDFALKYHAELHLLDDDHPLTNSIPVICDLFRSFLNSLLTEHRKCSPKELAKKDKGSEMDARTSHWHKEDHMGARFNRFLADDNSSKVQKLINYIHNLDVSDPYAFDIHLREKNKVMVYHGNTCVLNINTQGDGHFTAHRAYGEKPDCKDAYLNLNSLRNQPTDFPAIGEYLSQVVRTVTIKYQNEGKWMNILGVRFGRECCEDDEFVIIDRESVIGFGDSDQKSDFYDCHKQQRADIVLELQKADPAKWGTKPKSFGDELDFLALDKGGNLVCIELKYGKNTAGIYWGPLQASLYRDVFTEKIDVISSGIMRMVEQKISLGILPPFVKKRLPHGGFSSVIGILAVAEPNLRSVGLAMATTVNELQREKGIGPIEIRHYVAEDFSL